MFGRSAGRINQTKCGDGMKDYLVEANIGCTIFFCIIFYIIPRVIKYLAPSFYNGLDKDKQEQLPSWAGGMFHHIVVAPYGLYMIYRDYITPPEVYNEMDYAVSFHGLYLVTYAFGYIMGDTIFFTIPELMKGRYEYAIHHIASIALYRGLLMSGGPVIRYLPHFFICEFSNMIFNSCWFIRNGGGKNSAILGVLEKAFAVVFFILRIVNLPCAVFAMLSLPGVEELGIYRFVLIPILFLQFMWLFMIIKALKKKMNAPADKTSADKVK